jgi:class 3 adenylate cyclase
MLSLLQDDMERKTIAIVLTDIIGSTKFIQRNGNLNSTKWFKAHDKLCISLITRFNGVLSDSSDGFLMYFNTVQDAIAFSIHYKKKLIQHKFPFKSRIGIHWDEMFIIKTPEALIAANHKRISLDGIGKNVAARAMSLCNSKQIILTHKAYLAYKGRLTKHQYIPSTYLVVCAGLYKFKGVANPEQLWVVGSNEAELQPPRSNDKAKKIAGPKRIRTSLKHKQSKEVFMWLFWRLGLIISLYLMYLLWPLLSSAQKKNSLNIDFFILRPFEYLQLFFDFIQGLIP